MSPDPPAGTIPLRPGGASVATDVADAAEPAAPPAVAPVVTAAPVTTAPAAAGGRVGGDLLRPRLIRAGLALLRTIAPVLPVPAWIGRRLGFGGALVVVTRAADVRAVLDRDGDFTIAEINGARFDRISGPFVLGLDRGARYDAEAAMLRAAVPPSDLPRLAALAAGETARRIARHRHTGQLDVVTDVARPVALALAARWLGVPGPDDATMARWMRALFAYSFVSPDEASGRAADEAAAGLRAHLDGLIAERRAALAAGRVDLGGEATVLDRLLAAPEAAGPDGDDLVRRNITGLVVGAVDTTVKAVTLALSELFDRTDALDAVAAAAATGRPEIVLGHVHEALRFRPHQPLVLRWARAETPLGRHTIPAGRLVVAVTWSASFDGRAVERPRRYRPDRPTADALTFGGGLHACFGRRVNDVTLPAIVGAVASLPYVGPAGRSRWAGFFPESLPVGFEPPEPPPRTGIRTPEE